MIKYRSTSTAHLFPETFNTFFVNFIKTWSASETTTLALTLITDLKSYPKSFAVN